MADEQDQGVAVETPEAPELDGDDKLEQNVTIEDVGPALKRIAIEVPESRIAAKFDESYEQLVDDAQVPGFRRGRAPRALIERRFGSSVKDDVKAQLLSESYSAALEEHEIDVLGEPDVKDAEDIEIPESGPLTFGVEVEVSPEVELPDFGELSVERKDVEVSDADIDQEFDRMRRRLGHPATITDKPIEADDMVFAEVTVLPGHEPADDAEPAVHEDRTAVFVRAEEGEDGNTDYRGHVVGIVVQDLGEQLIGKKVGETVDIKATGPSGHEVESIRDQAITIRLAPQEISRLEPAAMDAVLEQLCFETEDDARAWAREQLEVRAEREARADLHQQIKDQLIEKVELELPEKMTGRQVERALARRRMELTYRGVEPEQIEQQLAEMRGTETEQARTEAKEFFILDKAARELDIAVSEGEINGRVAMMAAESGRRPEKVRQEMHQRGELQALYIQLREQHTLDAILSEIDGGSDAGDDAPADDAPADDAT